MYVTLEDTHTFFTMTTYVIHIQHISTESQWINSTTKNFNLIFTVNNSTFQMVITFVYKLL